MKVKELLKLLYEDGWLIKNQEGSHLHMIHPLKPGKVTIPIHGKELKKGTSHRILKHAGLK